jgi:hypothetical protein
MRVLEFTGQSGAGKSTLNRELLRNRTEFNVKMHTMHSLRYRLFHDTSIGGNPVGGLHLLFMKWPKYKKWFFRHGYAKGKKAMLPAVLDKYRDILSEVSDATRSNADIPYLREYAWGAFIDHLIVYEIACSLLGEHDLLWIEDEGFVRGLTNVFGTYRGDDVSARITRYVSLCPKVDVILHVKVDPAVSLQRIRGRNVGSRLLEPSYSGMTDEAIVERFNVRARIYELGVGAFRDSGSRIVEVDTTNSDLGSTVRWCKEQLSFALGQV